MAASQRIELDPGLLEEIADRLTHVILTRIVEVLTDQGLTPQPNQPPAWLDAREMAHRLGVSREWVYEHADELGALRIGSGPRPRLRFPPDLLERQGGHPSSPGPAGQPAKRRPKPSGLIPIRAS